MRISIKKKGMHMNIRVKTEFDKLIDKLVNNGIVLKSNITLDDLIYKFEESLDEQYKAKHGVVYTPDYIAEAMVKRSLDKLIDNRLVDKNKEELKNLLKDLRIFDPCVGAGVYPIAIIDVYKEYYNNMKLEFNVYDIYDIIKHNIYCCDLDENAVEITRFKLWTMVNSLVDFEDFECNIVCGNTLVDEISGHKVFLGFNPNISEDNEFFSGGPTKIDYINIINKYNVNKKLCDKLKLYRMSFEIDGEYISEADIKNCNAVDFRLEFPEIFNKAVGEKGFDIVIGNPPYIGSNNIQENKEYLAKRFRVVGSGTTNLSLYFFELGMQLSKSDGIISMINTNKWIQADYGKGFRELLLKENEVEIVDFKSNKIFDNANVDVCITTINKGNESKFIDYADMENKLNRV